MGLIKKHEQDDKHVDKFGYASLQVGDSAALFNKHLQEFGSHYGQAAKNIGDTFASGETMVTSAERCIEIASASVPFLSASAMANAAATLLLASAQSRQSHHTARLASIHQERLALEKANHLMHTSSREYLQGVLETAEFYGKEEENANAIYLVFADSYQAIQFRLFLRKATISSPSDVKISVFDSLQDAFDAASTKSGTKSDIKYSSKSLIYFHSLEQIHMKQNLHIQDCHNFVFRSDAGEECRLVMTSQVQITRSWGTCQQVAFARGRTPTLDDESNITFIKCATHKSDDKNRDYLIHGLIQKASFFLMAAPILAMATTVIYSRRSGDRK